MISASRRDQGFTLTEVLIASAIAATVILAISQLLISTAQNSKNTKDLADRNSFINLVTTSIAATEACKDVFTGVIINPLATTSNLSLNIAGINYSSNTPLFGDPTSGFRITQMSLVDNTTTIQQVLGENGTTFYNRHFASLIMDFERKFAGTTDYVQTATEEFGVVLLVDTTTNEVVQCNGELSAAQACVEAGGLYDATKPPDQRCNIDGKCLKDAGFDERVLTGGGKGYDGTFCVLAHPTTGVCSCPGGYTRVLAAQVAEPDGGTKMETRSRYHCKRCEDL